jgi:histidinol-phosphatase (PHP family)
MIDFHVHCDYSVDAEGSVEEYARHALETGLKEICFTTHCDLDPLRRHHDGRVRLRGEIIEVTSDWVGAYVEDVRSATKTYGERGLKIRCGLEIGYTPGIESMIEGILSSFEFDFILGGVHTVEGVDIVSASESEAYFARKSPREVCVLYYHSVGEAIRSGLFDCIAHMDIYKRCGLDFYGEPLNVAHKGLVEPLLEEMAARDLSLEVNGGGLRKGLEWPYPSPDIVEAAGSAGVAFVTPGSDAHRPDQVGFGIDRCLESAERAGFERVAVYEGRSRQELTLRQVYGS